MQIMNKTWLAFLRVLSITLLGIAGGMIVFFQIYPPELEHNDPTKKIAFLIIPCGLVLLAITWFYGTTKIEDPPPLPGAEKEKLSEENVSQVMEVEGELPSETTVEDESPDDGDGKPSE